ncbi:MAG: dihydroorotate dehydrogenase (quinone), partial [Proteobacteria bacterium]|nr:dihydroorotate dehydrogenase (quinone) [Pseudomonadota bacterium]
MSSYERLFAPIIQKLDPETAHDAAIGYLRYNPFGRDVVINDPGLSQTIWGLEFAHPVGLAAGFDKNAEVPDAVLRRGAAFVEVGTVTPKAQPGNDKPRMFRLTEDAAVINRLGFNNGGLDAYTNRLRRRRENGRAGIVGANVGKNKTSTDAV